MQESRRSDRNSGRDRSPATTRRYMTIWPSQPGAPHVVRGSTEHQQVCWPLDGGGRTARGLFVP